MKRTQWPWIVIGALLLLASVGACGLLKLPTPTAEPTEVVWTSVPATSTPVPPPTVTPLPPATVTAEPSATAGPEPTATGPAPSPTATATEAAPPATLTATPTRRPPTSTPVPPTLTPAPTATPVPPVITDWRGEYFANLTLLPPARLVRNDRTVDLMLVSGAAPAPGMPATNWSARFSRLWTFDEGNYRFRLLVDDGARLWVGGRLLIDAWTDGPARQFTAERYLKGQVPIQVEYYNRAGESRVMMNWEPVTQYTNWVGSYYDSPTLSGLPVFQRDDALIKFYWGIGAARADLSADNFSVRWSRRLGFPQAGRYRFQAESDDGLRLWVDGQVVIDAWFDGRSTKEGVADLSAGSHDLVVEYYERVGDALVDLTWSLAPAAPTVTIIPSPIPPQPTPERPSPTPVTPAPPQDTPVPINPAIVLQPAAGPVGTPFGVVGSGWPANASVSLFLLRTDPTTGRPAEGPISQVTADAAGRFETQLVVPLDEGWEGLAAATLLAESPDGRYRAKASYRLLPELIQVKFARIPTDQERFARPEAIYLMLDSQAAWEEQFGQEPPPGEPVGWERDILLGAFLGAQPAKLKVGVASLVQRGNTVSVRLDAAVPEGAASGQAATNLPRVLIRVSRAALLGPGSGSAPDLVYLFLDATGRVLAQGSRGVLEIRPMAVAMEARSLQAAAAPPSAAAPQAEAVQEAPQPTQEALKAAGAGAVAGQVADGAEAAEEARTPWVEIGTVLLIGAGVALWMILNRSRRRRQGEE